MTTPLSVVMDGLVSAARSTRDGVFNTLDAVDRQTKLASDSLARQVQRFCAEQAAAARARNASPEPARDARFDPEDEWDLRARDALASGAAAASGAGVARDDAPIASDTATDTATDTTTDTATDTATVTTTDTAADDEDDYPQTWLR